MLATLRSILDVSLKAIAVFGVVAIAYLTLTARPPSRSPTTLIAASQAGPAVKAELRVERFQDMGHGRHVWARLSQRDPRTTGSFAKYAAMVAHNYLIYDPETGASWRLHTHDADLLMDVAIVRGESMLPTVPNYGGAVPGRADSPARAIVFGVIDSDSNGDGQRTPDDARRLFVADPSGRNAWPTDISYDEILGVSMIGDRLLAILGARGSVEAVHIDLASKTIALRNKM